MLTAVKRRITRSSLSRIGVVLTVMLAVVALWVPGAYAGTRAPVKVLDFQTGADVAKAEQEGEVVYYGHDGEAGIAVLLDAFKKDFPKIKTSYVRLQTGALYAKITAERSAGRFGVDVLQLSDISPAIDFQKKGGYEQYVSPEYAAYKPEHQCSPGGYYGWGGVTFAGIAYNRTKVTADQAPKAWKDILNPAYKDGSAPSSPPRACSTPSGTCCASSTATSSGRSSPSSAARLRFARPALRPAVQGRRPICVLAEYAGYTLFTEKGAEIEFVAPADGLPATSFFIGVVNQAPHPEAAKLFVDWALSSAARPSTRTRRSSSTGRCGPTRRRCRPASGWRDFKLLFPSDWTDYVASHPVFVKEWNAIMGL